MTLHIYAHTPQIDEMNERRAICRMGHVLYNSHCRFSEDDHYLFIGNIDPTKDRRFDAFGKLTQLDGLLLGSNFIAIVEFKNYYDPIQVKKLEQRWVVQTRNRDLTIRGGSKRNPYFQAKHARTTLYQYLKSYNRSLFAAEAQNGIHALYNFVLFHPTLHPQSTLPPFGADDYWFHVREVGAIAELALAVGAKNLHLTLDQMKQIAEEAFFAEPWREMGQIMQFKWGDMMTQEPADGTIISRPLWRHDEFTVGRSSQFGHRVTLHDENISRAHAHITVADNAHIRIVDLESKNGTYFNGKLIHQKDGVLIPEGGVVCLGHADPDQATKIWFKRSKSFINTEATKTNQAA